MTSHPARSPQYVKRLLLSWNSNCSQNLNGILTDASDSLSFLQSFLRDLILAGSSKDTGFLPPLILLHLIKRIEIRWLRMHSVKLVLDVQRQFAVIFQSVHILLGNANASQFVNAYLLNSLSLSQTRNRCRGDDNDSV